MPLEKILINIIFFMVVFLIIFLADFYIISKNKRSKGKKKTEKMTSQDMYIIKKFDLDDTRMSLKTLNFHMSVINAFIIAFVSTIICLTDFHIGIQLAISFVLLFGLIYSIYELYGRHLKKTYGKRKEWFIHSFYLLYNL